MYRWVEHAAELELEIEAESELAVFEQGFEAMRELLDGGANPGTLRERVTIEARDRAVLLADWLAELAFLAESEGLSPQRLASLELGDSGLEAVVEGKRANPPHLIKAATYHRLALEPIGSRWRATVILDV